MACPHGISTVLERRGVGANLQDHLQQRTIYKVSNVKTLNAAIVAARARVDGHDYALRRRGPLTMAVATRDLHALRPHSPGKSRIPRAALSLDKFGDPLHTYPAVTLSVCNLQRPRAAPCASNPPIWQRRASHPIICPRRRIASLPRWHPRGAAHHGAIGDAAFRAEELLPGTK